jgi:hypothetical protein
MDSGMIGKILKAKQYAQERERIEFTHFAVTLHGENNDHQVSYDQGQWNCECSYFHSHGVCSHTMALERVLEGMIHEQQAEPEPA